MRGGSWFIATLIAAAPLLLIYARLSNPKGWRAAWVKAWANLRFGVEVCAAMLRAGLVMIVWWSRPVMAGLRVRAVRHIRQESR